MTAMQDSQITDEREAGYHRSVKLAKRRAALDAASQVFRERGYADATLQEIAARGGMSTATLFKHFPTKAKLFEAIVREVWDFDDPPTRGAPRGSLTDALVLIGRDVAGRLGDEQTISFYRVFIAALASSPELGQVVLERGKLPYVRQLSAFLRACPSISVADEVDLLSISSQFVAMIADRVFWPRVLAPGNVVTDEEVEQAVLQATLTIAARLGSIPADLRPTLATTSSRDA